MGTIRFQLRSMLDAYEAKTGLHLTYEELSKLTDVSLDTLKSIANRKDYNPTLGLVSQIASALNIDPIEHLEWDSSEEPTG